MKVGTLMRRENNMDVIESYKVTFMGEGKVSLIRCLRKKTNTKKNVGAVPLKTVLNLKKDHQISTLSPLQKTTLSLP